MTYDDGFSPATICGLTSNNSRIPTVPCLTEVEKTASSNT